MIFITDYTINKKKIPPIVVQGTLSTGEVVPLLATAVGDGTYKLAIDTELTATIDPTGLATSALQTTGNSSLSNINSKIANDIGVKTGAVRTVPANDITDATYIGDIKFGEGLPGGFYRCVEEITRPANVDQYATFDAIADVSVNNTTHAIVGAGRINGGSGSIQRAVLKTDLLTWTTAITIIIYDRAPPDSWIADNAAFDSKYVDSDNVVGAIAFPAFSKDATGAAGSYVKSVVDGLNIPYRCADDSTYIYWQAFLPSGTPTPASGQKFKLNLGVVRD